MTNKTIERTSKITPKKIGQFVSIWKRNNDGITVPYDVSDDFEILIIHSKSDKNIGQFNFPKSILVEKGIISINALGGKRGIRVYPPWDKANNKQAIQTQVWQLQFWNFNE